MYEIVCISRHETQSRRSTIAAGFEDNQDARQTLVQWLAHFFPNSEYEEELDCWRVRDHAGQTHKVFIEPRPQQISA